MSDHGTSTITTMVDGFTFTFTRDDGPITAEDVRNLAGTVAATRELRARIRDVATPRGDERHV